MKIWNALSQPPKSALKTIKGGRLQGMTDINPQWRYKAMTEQFGVCGVGWTYEIDKMWTESGTDDQVCAFAKVTLYTWIPERDDWSRGIAGIGGSMMVAKERAGPYTSDECYKMAVTDALSVAMKMLGVASGIYEGLWDGSKYRDAPPTKSTHKATQKSDPEPSEKDDEISKAQWKYIKGCGEKIDLGEQDVVKFIKWVAKENGIEPRHWKITKLVLPEANFNTEYAKYTQREDDE